MTGRGNIKPGGKPFVKGDSRINRKGRPKKLPDLDRLLIEVLSEKNKDREAMKIILLALRKNAMQGDVRSAEVLMDRAYGKLKTSGNLTIDLENLDESSLDIIINRLLSKNENLIKTK